jgi:hypothetical protein
MGVKNMLSIWEQKKDGARGGRNEGDGNLAYLKKEDI